MRVIFVIGPPGAGKSTYIRNNFPDAVKIDLLDYQKKCFTIADVIKSYDDAEKALREALKEAKRKEEEGCKEQTVILEHTLLMAKRRPQYLNAVMETVGMKPEVHVVFPEQSEYMRRCREEGIVSPELLDAYEIMEPPEESEGFSRIEYTEDTDKKGESP